LKLYVVATPIGNLDDISARAISILKTVDLIAAEDTRHSRTLMQHYGIESPLIAYHDHNEAEASESLVAKLLAGTSIALISDAGTPLISDPGYRLVKLARERGIEVIPIPGPSALTAALSVSGLPTDRFLFIGFLPSKQRARQAALQMVSKESATIVCYESRHRIAESIRDMAEVLGGARVATVARELTKRFEQTVQGPLAELSEALNDKLITEKGEFVVMIQGADSSGPEYDHVELMRALLVELPPRKAAGVVSQITGESRKTLYDIALSLKQSD
jgi:16S rRNA (cytidine1402-2'-O)-methyltransferase